MCEICHIYFTADDLGDIHIETYYKYVNCNYYCLRVYYKENKTTITLIGKQVFSCNFIIKVTPNNIISKIQTILVYQ